MSTYDTYIHLHTYTHKDTHTHPSMYNHGCLETDLWCIFKCTITHTYLFLWIVGTFHRLLLLLYWPNDIFLSPNPKPTPYRKPVCIVTPSGKHHLLFFSPCVDCRLVPTMSKILNACLKARKSFFIYEYSWKWLKVFVWCIGFFRTVMFCGCDPVRGSAVLCLDVQCVCVCCVCVASSCPALPHLWQKSLELKFLRTSDMLHNIMSCVQYLRITDHF